MNTTKFNQLFYQFEENETYRDTVQKAQQRFSFQPFANEYANIFTAAKVSTYLLPSISMVTGSLFIGATFLQILPSVWFAYPCSIGLVVLLEYFKAITLDKGILSLYKGSKQYWGLLPFVFLFCFGSAFISLQGAKEVHQQLNTVQQDYSAQHQAKRDSLITHYEKEKAALDHAMIEYKKSVSWKGKIDIHNKANKAYFENYAAQQKALDVERSEQLRKLEAAYHTGSREVQERFALNESIMLAVVLSIEVFILLAHWFLVFYDYKTVKEVQLMQQPEPVTVQLSEVRDLLSSYLVGIAASKPPKQTGKNSDVKAATDLATDIKNGIRDYRYLMNKHQMNVSTVKAAIDNHEGKGGGKCM